MSKRQSKQAGRKVHTQRANTLSLAPVAIGVGISNVGPNVHGEGQNITIRHREFFSTLTTEGSNPNQVSYWTIQPGWASMFPWLSKISQNYEIYRFDELVFEYHPRVPATDRGTVVLVIDPDPDDDPINPDEIGRQQLLAHLGAHENSVWHETKCVLRASALRLLGTRYVRTSGNTVIEPRTSDLGRLYAASYGTQYNGSTVLGDLWVSYSITLSVPQFSIDSSTINGREQILGSSFITGTSWTPSAIPQGVDFDVGSYGTTEPSRSFTSKSLKDTISLLPQFQQALSGFMMNQVGTNSITAATFTGAIVTSFYLYRMGTAHPPPDLTCRAVLVYSGIEQPLRSVDLTVAADPVTVGIYLIHFTFQGEVPSMDQGYLWKIVMNTTEAGWCQTAGQNTLWLGDFVSFRDPVLGAKLRNLNRNGRSFMPCNAGQLIKQLDQSVWREVPDLSQKLTSSVRSGMAERLMQPPPVVLR